MLSYYFLRSLINMLSHIPFGVLYVLSDLLFYPFYHIIRYRRKIVRKNLTESFPDKSKAEIVGIEKKFYRSFIDVALESCKLMTISPEEISRHMKFTNVEIANEDLEQGKSVSLFMGHYGNWEWVTSLSLTLYKGAVLAQIYRRLRNKAMDRIMREVRERMGSRCVEMRETVRFMAHEKAEGRPCIIGFIADQSPKHRDSKYFVEFMNHNVPVQTGTEKATKHFGYKALFVGMKRVRRGYYECELTPLHDNPETLPDFELTDLYFKRLEREIKERPELYLWTHNRFKYAKPSAE